MFKLTSFWPVALQSSADIHFNLKIPYLIDYFISPINSRDQIWHVLVYTRATIVALEHSAILFFFAFFVTLLSVSPVLPCNTHIIFFLHIPPLLNFHSLLGLIRSLQAGSSYNISSATIFVSSHATFVGRDLSCRVIILKIVTEVQFFIFFFRVCTPRFSHCQCRSQIADDRKHSSEFAS